MQQILNYTTKVERIQHAQQEQGEINRFIQSEDYSKFTEELKDRVTTPEDTTTENRVKDKEESSPSPHHHPHEKREKKEEEGKEIIELSDDESSTIDLKI